jgi:diacylglycerol kinase family enzyme
LVAEPPTPLKWQPSAGSETPPAARSDRVYVVVNPQAGGATDRTATVRAVREAFRDAHIEAEVEVASGQALVAAMGRAAERAKRGEFRAVVVGGGDGTINAAAGAFAGTGMTLGILRLGTLNHFARDAGIPFDLTEAVAIIKANHVRLVDVGDMNGRTFVNNSSIGIYPQMVLDREMLRKRHPLGKWPAMLLAVLGVLRGLSHRRLRVRAGGAAHVVRTPLIFVGNNQYGMDAFALGRRLRLDEGELWLYVVRSTGVLGLVRIAARLALGLPDVDRDLIVSKAARATIEARSRRLLVALDGEVVALQPPLRYSLRPKALALLAPEDQR